MKPPLDGILVVDFTQGVSGPYCTRMLSQLGARVIKIERPDRGDTIRGWDTNVKGMCSGHVWVNPGKESLALDLKSERGKAIALQLIERCDVVIANYVPGVLERMGLGPGVMKDTNPRAIICQVSGFGQEGPYRERSALDFIIQGETGILRTNGTPEGPAKLSISAADLSGSMYAFASIMTGLYQREQTGRGEIIDVAMFDTLMSWSGYFPYLHWYQGREPGRVGMSHHTLFPYGPYPARDGRSVIIAAGGDSTDRWRNFCTVIGLPELVEHPDYCTNTLRLRNREALNDLIGEAMLRKSRDEWIPLFDAVGIPAGAMNEFSEGMEHPRMEWAELVQKVPSAVGEVKILDFPVKFGSFATVNEVGPPELGQHTDSILAELGYSVDERSSMATDGVVRRKTGTS